MTENTWTVMPKEVVKRCRVLREAGDAAGLVAFCQQLPEPEPAGRTIPPALAEAQAW